MLESQQLSHPRAGERCRRKGRVYPPIRDHGTQVTTVTGKGCSVGSAHNWPPWTPRPAKVRKAFSANSHTVAPWPPRSRKTRPDSGHVQNCSGRAGRPAGHPGCSSTHTSRPLHSSPCTSTATYPSAQGDSQPVSTETLLFARGEKNRVIRHIRGDKTHPLALWKLPSH